jgi:hypothetical protein
MRWGNKISHVKRRIENDEVIVGPLFQCKFSYVKKAKVVWNVTL